LAPNNSRIFSGLTLTLPLQYSITISLLITIAQSQHIVDKVVNKSHPDIV